MPPLQSLLNLILLNTCSVYCTFYGHFNVLSLINALRFGKISKLLYFCLVKQQIYKVIRFTIHVQQSWMNVSAKILFWVASEPMNKMKNKTYHAVGTAPKYIWKIVRRNNWYHQHTYTWQLTFLAWYKYFNTKWWV